MADGISTDRLSIALAATFKPRGLLARLISRFMGSTSAAALIRAERLLDVPFYRSTYGLDGLSDRALTRHFLRQGLVEGLLPRADFDPVLCRLAMLRAGTPPRVYDSDYGFGDIWSFWQSGGQPLSYTDFLSDVTRPDGFHFGRDLDTDEGAGTVKRLSYEATRSYAEPKTATCTIDGRQYRLLGLPSRFVIDRLSADRPVAMARLPHGFWDGLLRREQHRSALRQDAAYAALSQTQQYRAAERLIFETFGKIGSFIENQQSETLELLASGKSRGDRFMQLVAFRGFPLHDPNFLFNAHAELSESQVARLRLFAAHFSPEDEVYDGLYWKRGVISGGFRELPAACRDRPVVLFGPDFLGCVGERWALPDFQHVRIPPLNSQAIRFELLGRLRLVMNEVRERAARQGQKSPVLLTQCGGSFAYWMIHRLFADFPEFFYLDMGQALNAWCLDLKSPVMPWVRLYGHALIENLGLEPLYRDRLGAGYAAWTAPFYRPPGTANAPATG